MATPTINPATLFSAKGLVAVITGGGTGLGLTMATALAQSGAQKVYILGRRANVIENAAANINANSPDVVVGLAADVSDLDSIKKVAAQIEKDVGFIDILINNAGITGPDHKASHDATNIKELQDVLLSQTEKWESCMAINVTALANVSAVFLPLLDAGNSRRGWVSGKTEPNGAVRARNEPKDGVSKGDRRTSQIISVASIAGFNRYVTAGLAYASSKAGAIHLGKCLATMLAPYGIRSNVICPGLFPSEMTEGLKMEHPVNMIPAHRPGGLEEFAATLLYMVGQSGGYLNGSVQVVDGGRLSVMTSTY
ncbi:NAD(P)-binding protein [Microthyrium microscopicum]|uniref:NAD(P)-binding protein n=1 Tax=Microthyrium microscopicum TaxID=703497 RepID=A0A6A6UI71_9PEZI|nr:NAD(P)-binding protein [Microthyrium microscopicum]